MPESALLVVYLSSYAICLMYWDGELSAAKAGRDIGKLEKSGKRHGRDHENKDVDGGDERSMKKRSIRSTLYASGSLVLLSQTRGRS